MSHPECSKHALNRLLPLLPRRLAARLVVMSHPEFLKQKFAKAGSRGRQPPGGVWGVPTYSFYFFCSPPQAANTT
jgi:hypothetical protein